MWGVEWMTLLAGFLLSAICAIVWLDYESRKHVSNTRQTSDYQSLFSIFVVSMGNILK
jgi:hypothetical protein